MIEVSTATRVITPKNPCWMGGYAMRTLPSDGVLDDLKCSVLVLKIDGEPVVMCSLDILMIFSDFTDPLRRRIERELGVKYDNITIATIHTHAAPELRPARLPQDNAVALERQSEYRDFLVEQVFNTVKDCFDKSFCEAEASFATINVEGFYGNRNGLDKPEDKDATVIRFSARDGRVVGAAVNISCHPTVLGADNLKISSDLLGYISCGVRKRLGVYPVMIQGAAGDMSNRHYRQGHDAAELKRTGDGILAQLFSHDVFQPLSLAMPDTQSYNMHEEYDIDVAQWQQLKADYTARLDNETEYDRRKLVLSCLAAIDRKLAGPHIVFDFNASILRMGELVICRVPCELFSRFGKKIKAACPTKLPLIWGYANDYAGYLSDEGEYGRTYESMISLLPKGGTEKITADLCEIVSK